MPTFADLIDTAAMAKLQQVRAAAPTQPSTEPATAYEALADAMDAQDAEDEAMLPASVPNPEPITEPTEEITMPEQVRPARVTLSHLSDGELGRMMRAALLTLVVDELPDALAEVLGRRNEAQADREALLAQEQAERQIDPSLRKAGFVVGTLTVPDLDLRDVTLGEVAPAKARSAYNRARYRLGMKEVLDPETTTWSDLAAEHVRLAAMVPAQAQPTKAKKPKKAKDMTPVEVPAAPKVAVLAQIEPDRKAKIAALSSVLGITKKEAAKRIAAMA